MSGAYSEVCEYKYTGMEKQRGGEVQFQSNTAAGNSLTADQHIKSQKGKRETHKKPSGLKLKATKKDPIF